MTRAWLVGAALAAGCFAPDLERPAGSPPFRCSDGACPAGYHCAQALCVADGSADPPFLLASASVEASPQPVWDGTGFGAFWIEEESDRALHFTAFSDRQAFDRRLALTLRGDVAFASLYHPLARRIVLATRDHDDLQDLIQVTSFWAGDTELRDHFRCQLAPSPITPSPPSLALGPLGSVTLAYAYGAPPELVRDDLFVRRIDLGALPSQACDPTVVPTAGGFAAETSIAVVGGTKLLFWRGSLPPGFPDRNLAAVTAIQPDGTVEDPKPLAGLLRVPRVAVLAATPPSLGLIAEGIDQGAPAWFFSRYAIGGGGDTPAPLPANGLVPDIVAQRDRFVACALDADGELVLWALGAKERVLLGRVYRLSHADVSSCRLAVGGDRGEIAVAWQERLPGSLFRSYLEIITDY